MPSPSSSFDRQRFLALTRAVGQLRHELASPLSGMELHLEMACRRIERLGEGEAEALLRNVGMGRAGVARVTVLLEVLGEIAGGAEDEPREFSVRSALRRGAERHAGEARRLGVRLQLPGSGEDYFLLGCADRLEQAFADMTSYGVTHATAGGLVAWEVETAGNGGEAGLTFSSSLPPGAAGHLFSLAAEGNAGEAGVSLFLARFSIESHGGTVAVEIPAEGTVRLAVRFTAVSGAP